MWRGLCCLGCAVCEWEADRWVEDRMGIARPRELCVVKRDDTLCEV